MESLLSVTALWPLALVGWEFVLGVLWYTSRRKPEEAMSFLTCASLATPPILIWIGLIIAFLRRYRSTTGATTLLLLFHVTGWLLVIGFCLCLSSACILGFGSTGPALTTVMIGAPMLALGWWLYRRARGILRRMHDQLAARTAAPEPKS
ncbi:MAG: hypothetical protein JXA69_00165 [Phycisphaerae bacterium]|nr:hypothetical protein [Phycisphaerae bacterium]